jgi:hypothetical protein
MKIYVGPLRKVVPTEKWKYGESAHLYGDTEKDLISFGIDIGLRAAWIHRSSIPHFDLTKGKHKQALANGAIMIDLKEEIEILKRWDGFKIK